MYFPGVGTLDALCIAILFLGIAPAQLDGDGWSDVDEKEAGTDPLDRLSFPGGKG